MPALCSPVVLIEQHVARDDRANIFLPGAGPQIYWLYRANIFLPGAGTQIYWLYMANIFIPGAGSQI